MNCALRIERFLEDRQGSNVEAKEIAQRTLPDIDFLVVFPSAKGPTMLDAFFYDRCKEAFIQEGGKLKSRWTRLIHDLHADFNIADRDADPIDEFMLEGRLHIDFSPVPQHVWQSLPYFVEWEEDTRLLHFVRDLSFTCGPLAKGVSPEVPLWHRINRLLFLLRAAGQTDREALLSRLANTHPFSRLIRQFSEVEAHFNALWNGSVDAALRLELITENSGRSLSVSEKGQGRIEKALHERAAVYSHGFPVPG